MQIKRPLVFFALSLVSGIVVSEIKGLIEWIFITGFMLVLLLIIARRKVTFSLFVIYGMIVLFFAGALTHYHVYNNTALKFIKYDGEYVKVKGFVDSEPDVREQKILCTIRTEKLEVAGRNKNSFKKDISGRLLLTVPIYNNNTYGDKLEYGTNLEFEGYLNMPQGSRNPEGFDYRKYLIRNDISATVYFAGENIVIYGGNSGNFIQRAGYNTKAYILNIINSSITGQQRALLSGMLLGYRKGFSKEEQAAFSNAGLTHIMAVSGLHVGFIVMMFIFLFKNLFIDRRISYGIIIALLVFYALVTGFTASVTRAVIMASVFLAGKILRRESDALTSISFAGILMLLTDPFVLFDIGFQLSFCAALSIILMYRGVKSHISVKFIPEFIVDILSVTISAQIGVIPLIALYFNRISLVSLIANLFVVPILQLIITVGFIMVITGIVSLNISRLVGYCEYALLSYVLFIVKCSAAIPFSSVTVPTPSFIFAVTYYALLLFVFWYVPLYKPDLSIQRHKKQYGLLSTVIILLIVFTVFTPRQLEVVFLDVGEGDSIFIRSPAGSTVLIDGGGNEGRNTDYDVGESVVVPFILDYGCTKVDLVMGTHGHNDHIGGLYAVFENLRAKDFAIPAFVQKDEFKELLEIAYKKGINVIEVGYGDNIRLDRDTNLKVLNPAKELGDNMSLNNSSIVVKLIYKDISMLLTGDIEKEAEMLLVKRDEIRNTDILKVPHHGSETSSVKEFLKYVNPSAAVISVGRNNFGHPSEEVLERYGSFGIKVYRTDLDGAVTVKSNGSQIKIDTVVKSGTR